MDILTETQKTAFTIKDELSKWTSTLFAVEAFNSMLPEMGRIVRVIGTAVNREYLVRFFTDDGQRFDFHGFSWWYRGEGPNGLTKCLKKIGVKRDILERLHSYNEKDHGDVDDPNGFVLDLKQEGSWVLSVHRSRDLEC